MGVHAQVRRAHRPTGGADARPEHTAETCEQGEHLRSVSRDLRTCVMQDGAGGLFGLTNFCPRARPARGSRPLDKVLGHGRHVMMCTLVK